MSSVQIFLFSNRNHPVYLTVLIIVGKLIRVILKTVHVSQHTGIYDVLTR